MQTGDDFAALWPRQFRVEMEKRRASAVISLGALKQQDSAYAQAHRNMIAIYDAALGAIRGDMISPFVLMSADRLAGEVCRLVDDHTLDARSGAGDALLDYAATRFHDSDYRHDPIGGVRVTFNDLPTTPEGRKFESDRCPRCKRAGGARDDGAWSCDNETCDVLVFRNGRVMHHSSGLH